MVPYVGASAFVHKAGLHASAIIKDPSTYEHIDLRWWEMNGLSRCQIRPVNRTCCRLADAGIEVDRDHPSLGHS